MPLPFLFTLLMFKHFKSSRYQFVPAVHVCMCSGAAYCTYKERQIGQIKGYYLLIRSNKKTKKIVESRFIMLCMVYGVQRYIQQYLRYIVAVGFIGGGNQSTRRNPPT